MSFLRLEAVSKRFGAVAALDGVSLEVAKGGRMAVIGPSGSGKTTLLRLVAGFEMPDAGRIAIDGEVVADAAMLVPAHRRGIGFVAQDGALFPHLTVAANIGFGLDRNDRARHQRIAELMGSVELDRDMAERRPHQLSGGQQQRVALARALARRPRLMLLDEPFSALDTSLRDSVRRMVVRVLGAAGVTTILVTHDQAEAMFFADEIAVLEKGRLMQAGPPRELYLKPRDGVVARLLGEVVALPAELAGGYAVCALGRLPVDAADRSGPGTILLRPEQIRLVPASGASPIRVNAAEFGGPASIVTLSIEGVAEPVSFRMSTAGLPPVGAPVEVVVAGAAHLLS